MLRRRRHRQESWQTIWGLQGSYTALVQQLEIVGARGPNTTPLNCCRRHESVKEVSKAPKKDLASFGKVQNPPQGHISVQ